MEGALAPNDDTFTYRRFHKGLQSFSEIFFSARPNYFKINVPLYMGFYLQT